MLADGTDKDLVEMKLLSGCDNEANDCMAGIGVELWTVDQAPHILAFKAGPPLLWTWMAAHPKP